MAHGHECCDLNESKSIDYYNGGETTTEEAFPEPEHPLIPKELKEKIRSLMKDYPKGINANQLEEKFREKFYEKLDVRKFKFFCVPEFCFHLEDVVVVQRSLEKNAYFIHPIRNANNELNFVPEISPLGMYS